jgi:hypothetical protein
MLSGLEYCVHVLVVACAPLMSGLECESRGMDARNVC